MKSVTLLQYSDMIHFEFKIEKEKKIINSKKKTITKSPEKEFGLIRISELKPRLTKFIKNELKKADVNVYEEFKDLIENRKIFPEDKGASYFKITTEPKKVEKYIYKTFGKEEIGSYFGEYCGVWFDEVEVKVFSRVKRLEELVEKALKSFLIINNLGQRQSKGFGSFVVKGTTKEEVEKILKNYYKSVFKKELYEDDLPLEIIHKEYKLIKSGINESYFRKGRYHQGKYEKSKLFEYFCNKNIRWEKRRIKELLRDQGLMNKLEYHHEPIDCNKKAKLNYKYIRGLLGVAPLISFKQKNSSKPFNVTISGSVDRYPSPITFKIFDDIYAVANNIDKEILDKKFFFKVGSRKVRIDTPSEFNLPVFMNYAFSELNWQRIK